ncbi:hypothetical protein CONLIGDRAFT_641127 [Coniochaeta ligniaria NRRL 30616]|uniref:Uncharacterized protein n=1 Tax=Coniochaeta ligniaria NRRL 30616 TaxID=1408157 RepID=A0A1J7JVK0_9PEZI|nr:hypothetical protein CONLIGDRAFT_641127 [Coniochaeta ligniaria NRRL 30616]
MSALFGTSTGMAAYTSYSRLKSSWWQFGVDDLSVVTSKMLEMTYIEIQAAIFMRAGPEQVLALKSALSAGLDSMTIKMRLWEGFICGIHEIRRSGVLDHPVDSMSRQSAWRHLGQGKVAWLSSRPEEASPNAKNQLEGHQPHTDEGCFASGRSRSVMIAIVKRFAPRRTIDCSLDTWFSLVQTHRRLQDHCSCRVTRSKDTCLAWQEATQRIKNKGGNWESRSGQPIPADMKSLEAEKKEPEQKKE